MNASPFAKPPQLLVEGDDPRPLLATLIGADFSALSLTPARGDHAPGVVREALERFAPHDALHGVDLAQWHVRDLGNAGAIRQDWAGACKVIGSIATRAFSAGDFTITLGGDHSVTWPLVAVLAAQLGPGQRVGVLQLDIHHDVRPLDAGPSNGTPIRGLIEQGVVAPKDVVQIGIHPFANRPNLTAYCDEVGIHRHDLATIAERGMRTVVRDAFSELTDCSVIYLTVDIDVLDRSFAPGTVAALPGGLTPGVLAEAVEEICSDPRVRAMDVVEFDPTRDVQSITAYNVVHVLLTALSAVARRKANQ